MLPSLPRLAYVVPLRFRRTRTLQRMAYNLVTFHYLNIRRDTLLANKVITELARRGVADYREPLHPKGYAAAFGY